MNFATLRQRLGRRRGFDGNDARLGDFVNDAYMILCGRRNTWSWLRRAQQVHVHSSESGTVGTVTNGSRLVTALTPAATQTRSGAKIQLSGEIYRVARTGAGFGSSSTGSNTQLYLESEFNGNTASASQAWTIHYDEYALPAEAASVESVILTKSDSGVTGSLRYKSHNEELSLLPPHMHKMQIVDREARPQYYSIIRGSQLPIPDPPTLVVGTGASGGFNGQPAATSRYKYRMAFQNLSTYEIGPWSSPSEEFDANAASSVAVSYLAHGDFGAVFYRTRGLDAGDSFDTATYYLRSASSTVAASATPTFTDSGVLDTVLGVQYGGFGADPTLAGRAFGTSTSGRIRLWPPPDENYTLDILYYVTPQELSRDDDTPVVPRAHHPVILDLAESLALSEEENHSAAAQKRAYAMEAVDRMEREDEIDPGTVIQIGRNGQYPDRHALGDGWPGHVTGD